MAKKEHRDLIRQGVMIWNQWRERNISEEPDLSGVNLCTANLSGVNLAKSNLWEANLSKGELRGADLREANLCFTDMSGSDLRGADLRGANLTNADLSAADLGKADFRNTKLWGTNLSRSTLRRADFTGADLNGAKLAHADLSYTNFRGANFSDADFSKALFSHTNLSHSDLRGADFRDSRMEWSVFADVDLSRAKGLDSILHRGPSTVGIDTTYQSGGRIPKAFLRGTGIPNNFINYMTLLAQHPIRFYSCFILYAVEDKAFAEHLFGELYKNGVRCWLSRFGSRNSDSESRKDVFRVPNSAVLFVLSEHSAGKDWAESDMETALEMERKTGRIILFPLTLDPAVQKNIHADIRQTRPVSDFSLWKNSDAYQAAFKQLLRTVRDTFPREKTEPEAEKEAPLSSSASPGIGSLNFPQSAAFRIIGENNCPLYTIGDELKVSGKSVLFPEGKSACLILLEDITVSHTKYESTGASKGYAFKCSGCSGTVRLKYQASQTIPRIKRTGGDTDASATMLSTFSMFQNLSESDIRHIVSFLRRKTYDAGDIILTKGEPGKNLFIVISGTIEVIGEGGISLAVMGTGEVFGEMSLLSGNPVGATVKVVEPVSVLYMNGREFKSILKQFPSLQMYFTRLLARRLAEIQDIRAEEFASGMVGKLSEMPPTELFQTLNINQKTGILNLKLSKGTAEAAFREGSPVRVGYDGLEGTEAFYEILKEKEGRFKFSPGLSADDMEADEIGDFMWLLMEGTRQMDEKK